MTACAVCSHTSQLCDACCSCDVAARPDEQPTSLVTEPLVRVRVLQGLSSKFVCDVQLSRRAMVWELKFNVARESGIYWRMQRLLLEGRCLEDGERMEDLMVNGCETDVVEVALLRVKLNDQPPLNDHTALLGIVSKDGMALQFASGSEMVDDEDIVLQAISQNPDALLYASERLRSDKAVVLQAVSQMGRALRHATLACRSDRSIVLAAVKQDGMALAYATKELRKDREIEKVALQQNPNALQYAGTLSADQDAVLDAVTRESATVRYISLYLMYNRAFLLRLMACNGLALDHLLRFVFGGWKFAYDKEIVLAAVSQNGHALRYASVDLRSDKEVVLRAVSQRGIAIRYAAPSLAADHEVKAAAMHQRKEASANS